MIFNENPYLRNLFLSMRRVVVNDAQTHITDGHLTLSASLFGDRVTTDGKFDLCKLECVTNGKWSPNPAARGGRFPKVHTTGRWVCTGLVMPEADGDTYLYARVGSVSAPGVLRVPRRYIDVVYPDGPPLVLFGTSACLPLTTRAITTPTRDVEIAIRPIPTPCPEWVLAVVRLHSYVVAAAGMDPDWECKRIEDTNRINEYVLGSEGQPNESEQK